MSPPRPMYWAPSAGSAWTRSRRSNNRANGRGLKAHRDRAEAIGGGAGVGPGGAKPEGRGPKEIRRPKAEDRRPKTEGRRPKSEGRRPKSEGRSETSAITAK